MKIDRIVFTKADGTEIHLTEAEARMLYAKLDEMFAARQPPIIIPTQPCPPCAPWIAPVIYYSTPDTKIYYGALGTTAGTPQ